MFTDDRCGVHTITVARECTWFRERVGERERRESAGARGAVRCLAMTRVPTGDRCRMYMCGVSGFIIILRIILTRMPHPHPAIRHASRPERTRDNTHTDTRHCKRNTHSTGSRTRHTASRNVSRAGDSHTHTQRRTSSAARIPPCRRVCHHEAFSLIVVSSSLARARSRSTSNRVG